MNPNNYDIEYYYKDLISGNVCILKITNIDDFDLRNIIKKIQVNILWNSL